MHGRLLFVYGRVLLGLFLALTAAGALPACGDADADPAPATSSGSTASDIGGTEPGATSMLDGSSDDSSGDGVDNGTGSDTADEAGTAGSSSLDVLCE
ncbi:MAG: hypothetical protein JKY37_06880, partial [Nannocystaceae bacterium]|nr:hypothetical protein [Nannocystaceae bacterium]